MKPIKPIYVSELLQLTEDQRNNLVISHALDGRIMSYFADSIWDFSTYIYIKGKRKDQLTIDFSALKFRDGSLLTDLQHSLLLDSVKSFLYVRLTVVNQATGKTLKESSVISAWDNGMRPLLRWMFDNKYKVFSDLTSDICLTYYEHCKKTLRHENQLNYRSDQLLSASTIKMRLSLLENLWRFREHFTNSLPEHPWPKHSSTFLAGCSWIGGRDTITEQIPDRLMEKLITGALKYVTSGYGEQLLDCRDARDAGLPINKYLDETGLNYLGILAEISRLFTACYVVINSFSGMRISEIMSLEIGCYYEHVGWDGATYGWLKGTTYKLDEDPMPGEWMVPPVVRQAVDLLERATAKLRIKLEKNIEHLSSKLKDVQYINESSYHNDSDSMNKMKINRRCLFLVEHYSYTTINVMADNTVQTRLKTFAEHLNLIVEPHDLEQVKNKNKIQPGKIWPLSSHQFRKTFARYVARCVLGDVRYLKEHFKHWSLDMTLSYAWNEEDLLDPTLIEEILIEHQDIQSEIVQGWLDFNRNQHLAAVGGENIVTGRERSKLLVATNPHAVARQIAKGYFLRGLGHSWCTEKECKGKGIYSVTECKTCENRVIDESHIPIWYAIRQQQIELLHTDDCGDPIWQSAVDSLRYSEQILISLGEKIEPYSVPQMPSERDYYVY